MSPATTAPTPEGVPVRTRSPSCEIVSEICWTRNYRTDLQRHNRRDVFDESRNAKNHVRGRSILFENPVDLRCVYLVSEKGRGFVDDDS